jgi:hypothetical protein
MSCSAIVGVAFVAIVVLLASYDAYQSLLPRHCDHESLFCADHVVDVLGCGVDIDLYPFDFAVELVAAWAVVFRDKFAHVTPDLRRLVQPEGKEMCALDAPFSKLLAIEKQRDVRSLAETATAQVGSR